MTISSATYLTNLYQLLNQYFTTIEIKILFANLDVDYEDLSNLEKPTLIEEMLFVLARNGRLPDLITLAHQEHPHVDWPPLPDDFEMSAELASGETNSATTLHYVEGDVVFGDQVSGDKFTGDKIAGDKIQTDKYIKKQVIVQGVQITDIEQLPPEEGKPPYKGLTYFTEQDADWFFGREHVTAVIVNRLHDQNFLAIVGASGSGKSSLVRAGVIPIMKRNKSLADGTVPPLGNWIVYKLTPTARPLTKLADTLFPKDHTQQTIFLKYALKAPDSLQQAFTSQTQPEGQKRLLFIDQFEELFTQCKDETEREAFIINLLSTADDSCKIIITLRADFYAQCLRYTGLRKILKNAQEPLGAMNSQELTAVLLEPAAKGKWQFQTGLVEEILDDVGQEPGSLPLLSHALLETWQRRRGRVLTLSGYQEAGKVQQAIAQTAEKTLNNLIAQNSQFEHITRDVFLELTELGDGAEDTRRIANREELTALFDEEALNIVLEKLVQARLITTHKKEVEVAHEALIRRWPTLTNWLNDNREQLRFKRQLIRDANVWKNDLKEDESGLYRGARLARALEDLTSNDMKQGAIAREFLLASRELEERKAHELEERRQLELTQARELAEQREEARRQAVQVNHRNVALLVIVSTIALSLLVYYIVIPAYMRQAATNDKFSPPVPVTFTDGNIVKFEPYEVTNDRYAKCVEWANCDKPDGFNAIYPGWLKSIGDKKWQESKYLPVTNIDAADAMEFCEWIDRTLPTAKQWLAVAPPSSHWIDLDKQQKATYCIYDNNGNCIPPVPITETNTKLPQFPIEADEHNKTGIFDLVGNVQEWTRTTYDSDSEKCIDGTIQKFYEPKVDTVILALSFEFSSSDIQIYSDFDNAGDMTTWSNKKESDIGFRCISSTIIESEEYECPKLDLP